MFVAKERWTKRDKRNKKCSCTGYHFAHRRGSKWCHHNPGIDLLMQDETRSSL